MMFDLTESLVNRWSYRFCCLFKFVSSTRMDNWSLLTHKYDSILNCEAIKILELCYLDRILDLFLFMLIWVINLKIRQGSEIVEYSLVSGNWRDDRSPRTSAATPENSIWWWCK